MPDTQIIPTRNLGRSEDGCTYLHTNPLDQGFGDSVEPDSTLIAWAGWYDQAADPALGVFPSDHRLWNEGLDLLRQQIDALGPVLEEQNARLLLRPALGLVLSDPHSIWALFEKLPDGPSGVLVDPVAMLTPEMMEHAEDHLPRMFDKLGNLERCEAVILSGAAVHNDERLTHCPLDWSRPFDQTLLSCWRESVFAQRGVYLMSDACLSQIA
ncbi:MAG: hypothetical protein Phyf2KO_10010 [Phycisphaerales bacterium]